MLFLEPLLLLHELPNSDGDVLVEVVVPEVLGDLGAVGLLQVGLPVGLAAATVVVHAHTAAGVTTSGARARHARHALDGTNAAQHLGRALRTLRLQSPLSLQRRGHPLLHVIPEPVPDAVDAPAHAAVVGLLGPRRHQHTRDQCTAVAKRRQPFRPLDGPR